MKKDYREFIIKENGAFRIRVETWRCESPNTLFALNFHNDCLNEDGEVDFTSTYNFFLTKEEMQKLAESLTQ